MSFGLALAPSLSPAASGGGDWFNQLLRSILFLPPQASTVAREIDYLHYFVILTTMLGATAITLVGGIFLIKYRRRGGMDALKRKHPGEKPPVWIEALVVGFLLSLFCLWWAIGFVQYMRIRIAPEGTFDIYVTGKQWMWKFAYPDGNHSIATLYVPAGRPVKLIMTSRDVIHSFYVPEFRVKQDVLPGRYTTLWFTAEQPGTYRILCTEYCGTGHSTMRGQVVVLRSEDFGRWAESQGSVTTSAQNPEGGPAQRRDIPRAGILGPRYNEPATVEEFAPREQLSLVRVGELVAAQQGCLRCHTLDGTPHIGPTWAGLYLATVPLADGSRALADEAYLTESIMDPLARVHAGFSPVMPSYLGILRPAETASLVELIKSLRELPVRAEVPPAERITPEPTIGEPDGRPIPLRVPPAGAIGQPPGPPPEERMQRGVVPLGMAPPSQSGLPLPGIEISPPIPPAPPAAAAPAAQPQLAVPRPTPEGETRGTPVRGQKPIESLTPGGTDNGQAQ